MNKRKIYELKDSDINLVYIDERTNTPHCKVHGAMNKVTETGIWRCVTIRNCNAGCQETDWKRKKGLK